MNWIKCQDRLPAVEMYCLLWGGRWGTGELMLGYLNEHGFFYLIWHQGQPDILEPITEVTHWAPWPDRPTNVVK